MLKRCYTSSKLQCLIHLSSNCVTYCQRVLHCVKVCNTFCHTLLPKRYTKCFTICYTKCYTACYTKCYSECYTECYSKCDTKCYTKCYTICYTKCYTKCYTFSNAGLLSASRVSVEWTASLLVRLCRSFKETIILWCWGFNHNMLWKVIMVTMVWRTAGPSKKKKNAADLERNQEVRIKMEVVKMMGLVDCQHLCTVHTPAEYNRLKWK